MPPMPRDHLSFSFHLDGTCPTSSLITGRFPIRVNFWRQGYAQTYPSLLRVNRKFIGAGNRDRTDDSHLGKVELYH